MRERTYELKLHGIEISVTKKKMKNIYLRVRRDGTVTISAPHMMLDRDIRRFAEERIDWIRKYQEQFERQSEYTDTQPKLSDREIAVQKKLLKERVEQLIRKWEPLMGVEVSGVTIRQMRTRWGSCNVKTHHININLALWNKPEECLEYVVIHEMVHILEPSHNNVFWDYVGKYCPEWKRIRKYLRENGNL